MPVVTGKFRQMTCTPDGDKYRCVCQCGFIYKANRPNAAHGCRDLISGARPLSLMQKVANFAKAAVKHVASGMPMASEEEINRRFAICQTCPFLKNGACTKCGCPVNREKKFISKLAWADQKCPVGHW